MKHTVILAAAWLAISGAANAADPAPTPPSAAEASPQAPIRHIPAGTPVRIETAETLSSGTNFKGNTFAIRLAAPIIVDGGVLVPAGTTGVGEIISSGHTGPGGQSGKLVLAARYLDYKGAHIPLTDLRFAARGVENDLIPVMKRMEYSLPAASIVAAALTGEDVTISQGTAASARLASDVDLPVVARASSAELAAARAVADVGSTLDTRLTVPPSGKAQIVFFRRSLLSTALTSWRIWEGKGVVTDLGNGSYFVLTVDPGPHTFLTGLSGDSLTLEPVAGETYYIEQGAIQPSYAAEPVLYPSDETTFQELPKLKLAKPAKSKS